MNTDLTQPHTEDPAALTAPNHFNPLEGGHGEFKANEIQTPYLSIVQGVGDLAGAFGQGELVYNKETIIPRPANITIFGYKKFFLEDIPYDPEVRPQKFYSEADYKSAGLKDDEVKPGLEILTIIQLPDGLKEVAGAIDYEDTFYVRALWSVKGQAYWKVLPKLRLTHGGLKQRNLEIVYQPWTLSTNREKTRNGNWVQVPVFNNKEGGLHPQDKVDFFRLIFS